MYEIEKGVPIPETRGRPEGSTQVKVLSSADFPFSRMVAGDSFVFRGTRGTIISACARAQKKYGRLFSTRIQPDGSFRVWRVA